MNLIYPALTLHSAGKDVNEENLKKIVETIEVEVDDSEIKALVAALDGVDIEEAMENSVVASAPKQSSSSTKEEKEAEEEKEEEPEEEGPSEDEAAEGLGSLF